MALEDLTGTKYIDDLNSSNPAAGDNVSEGDDHIRGIKNVLKTTFPSIDGAITATDTELNYVDGVTSSIQTQIDNIDTDLVNDTSPQLGGDLASNGNDITMADDDKILLGTGGDLQLYCDNSNSYIKDAGAGSLLLWTGNGNEIKFISQSDGSETMADMNADGSVDLYYNNVKKFETTNTGVTVTGTVAATAVTGDGSGLTGVDPFPSGTKLSFFQASAPTGWTQDTSNNDKVLRVVSGTGGGTGGTHALTSPPSLAHTHTGPSHTHSVPSHGHSHSLSAAGHTLSISEMPAHTHDSGRTSGNKGGWHAGSGTGNGGTQTSTSTGGGGSHSHSMSGSITNANAMTSGASGTGTSGSTTPTAFAPQYINVIVCSKD
jgi:hypothetical protein